MARPLPTSDYPQSTIQLTGMCRQQLLQLCEEAGAKPVHAETLLAYVFRRGVHDPDLISDIPHGLRSYLRRHYQPLPVKLLAEQQAADKARKLLLRMPDGADIETVLIPGPNRLTQCISTQAGCAMGCKFCLTATSGLGRNLTAAEMVAQVQFSQSVSKEKIRNLVLMGMGEPLHNYDEVAQFVRIAADTLGMAFSPRRITLSTSGLVPAIYRLIRDDLPCSLAVSLNATTDAIRSQIMPVNKRYPIAELLHAVRNYIATHGRKRVLIEYVLLAGVNDSIKDAERLCALLTDINSTVNLLPFNAHPASPFQTPSSGTVTRFRSILSEAGIVAIVRESRGRDISAACGQLKGETASHQAENNHGAVERRCFS